MEDLFGLIILFVSLLSAIPVVLYWFLDLDALRGLHLSLRIGGCFIFLVPVVGNIIVFVYDAFFHIGRGTPWHEYIYLLLTPIALLISLIFLAIIVCKLISRARIKRKSRDMDAANRD